MQRYQITRKITPEYHSSYAFADWRWSWQGRTELTADRLALLTILLARPHTHTFRTKAEASASPRCSSHITLAQHRLVSRCLRLPPLPNDLSITPSRYKIDSISAIVFQTQQAPTRSNIDQTRLTRLCAQSTWVPRSQTQQRSWRPRLKSHLLRPTPDTTK